jgi:hypothetical protein
MIAPRRPQKRRAVAGIVAAIILFAMLFTSGMTFFLYQNNLSHQYDQANVNYDQFAQAKVSEGVSVTSYPSVARGTLNVSAVVSNLGTNYLNLTSFFIQSQSGSLVCFSPLTGSLTRCGVYYGHTSPLVKASLPGVVLNSGSGVNLTSDIVSTNAGLAGCSSKSPCYVGVITSRGNVFSTTYPGPVTGTTTLIETILNSTVIAPGHSVKDTALLSGVTSTAGGTVTYSWFGDGACGAFGGAKTSLAPVTVVGGIVPTSPSVKFSVNGSYSFQAAYSGDAKNPPAISPCEPLSVVNYQLSCNPTDPTCASFVSEGLGFIHFDFTSYKWYSYSPSCIPGGTIDNGGSPNTNPSTSCNLSPTNVNTAPLAYQISAATWNAKGCNSGGYCVFSANITNADPNKRQMTVNAYTQLWFSNFNLKSGGGTAQSWAYGIINVAGTPLKTQTTTPTVTLNFGQSATVFFGINRGGDPDQVNSYNASPVFLLIYGSLKCVAGSLSCTLGATTLFGQDFPLASTLWTS